MTERTLKADPDHHEDWTTEQWAQHALDLRRRIGDRNHEIASLRDEVKHLPDENRALRNKVDELTYLVNGYDGLADKQRQRAERAEEALWALWHEENEVRVVLKARFPELVEKILAAVKP